MIPTINDVPKYEVTVPSTGQTVRFRPYLVKEEKVLLTAFESKDEREGFKAIFDTLRACIPDLPKGEDLTLYDVLFLFAKVRGKSVGERVELNVPCKKCGVKNPVEVDIDTVNMNANFDQKTIKLDDQFSVEMKYPSYLDMINNEAIMDKSKPKDGLINTVAESIVTILTDDNRIVTDEEDFAEVVTFVESMNQRQFKSLVEYLDNAPKFSYSFDFECVSCNEKNEYNVTDPKDFF